MQQCYCKSASKESYSALLLGAISQPKTLKKEEVERPVHCGAAETGNLSQVCRQLSFLCSPSHCIFLWHREMGVEDCNNEGHAAGHFLRPLQGGRNHELKTIPNGPGLVQALSLQVTSFLPPTGAKTRP